MVAPAIPRPAADEYAPYYGTYIGKVPDGDLLELLERQHRDTQALVGGIPEAKALHRYAPEKWSIKEVIGHLCDAERIFCYRALRFARGDATGLPGWDEKAYVPAAEFDRRSLADLAGEFADVRRATVALFRSFDAAALARRGIANSKEISVRALAYIIAGHERHHVEILHQRYGV